MIAKVGTIVESDFGKGAIVAITDEWVIHKTKHNSEVAVNRKDDWICFPCDEFENGGGEQEIDLG